MNAHPAFVKNQFHTAKILKIISNKALQCSFKKMLYDKVLRKIFSFNHNAQDKYTEFHKCYVLIKFIYLQTR